MAITSLSQKIGAVRSRKHIDGNHCGRSAICVAAFADLDLSSIERNCNAVRKRIGLDNLKSSPPLWHERMDGQVDKSDRTHDIEHLRHLTTAREHDSASGNECVAIFSAETIGFFNSNSSWSEYRRHCCRGTDDIHSQTACRGEITNTPNVAQSGSTISKWSERFFRSSMQHRLENLAVT